MHSISRRQEDEEAKEEEAIRAKRESPLQEALPIHLQREIRLDIRAVVLLSARYRIV